MAYCQCPQWCVAQVSPSAERKEECRRGYAAPIPKAYKVKTWTPAAVTAINANIMAIRESVRPQVSDDSQFIVTMDYTVAMLEDYRALMEVVERGDIVRFVD